MSTMATTGGVPSGVSRNAMGTASSMAVPAWRHDRRERRGAQVARVVAVHRPPQPREARERAVARHHAHDRREVMVELGEARPEPERELHGHGAGDPVAGEGEADDGDPVVLAARGEEDRLVEHAEHGQEHDERQEVLEARRRGDQSARGAEEEAPRRAARRARRASARRARAGRARAAASSSRGAGSRGSRRRGEVPPGERAAPAAEAEDLEEHAPDDGLLEREGVQPPRRNRGRAPERRAEAAEEHPPADVEPHLEGVGGEDAERRAVPLHRPGLADHAPALGQRLLDPGERVIGRGGRVEEAHLTPPGYRIGRSRHPFG